ncbi:dipeptidase PepE [Pandoraea nosoerga]|uniref:dipeptidase PepE n=1 Tax=Pandoraea nosoerga TaxID=2508296 RepID=UPI0015830D6E|nr:dipeptidase PepE [Pandoraea nosoerga]MBN4667122.1 dipeptidase PepE [Pandoraea nosoerga]MBN4677111.1 dipeptidase PepE [Pandoraea nosoerga]MBN4681853.1 dipeptidase PepE [Pandoraea nosoerga]MBN4746227.1 dipeptidase PepE [Pandoraea nosoerga]
MVKQILMMSSSRKGNLAYMEHADDQLHAVLRARAGRVLFVPYAGGITFSYDDYEARVKPVFERLGYELESIHRHRDPRAAVERAQAIAVGGGNTFALLERMYDAGIVDLIRERVSAGVPYIGWSAGSNVVCPTIRTTNDMPIVEPPTFKALGLIPFQVNPHFIGGKPAGHNGESREERLAEYLAIHPGESVVGLPEGTALHVQGENATVLGEFDVLHFKQGGVIDRIATGSTFALASL